MVSQPQLKFQQHFDPFQRVADLLIS